MQSRTQFDVVIVGAGAAGIGTAIVLRELGIERFVLLERDHIGASFDHWPAEMHFITPSFPSNPFGLLDLNAVALNTSPAYGLRREHPTGQEYAAYLRTIAEYYQLPIETGVEVHSVAPRDAAGMFHIETSGGTIESAFVVWAAGEFGYPWLNPFPGAANCIHNTRVRAWAEMDGDAYTIIGGYESGIDAAYNLVMNGKRVHVLDGSSSWDSTDQDPSIALSPYTLERLSAARATGRLTLTGDTLVTSVAPHDGGYTITGDEGAAWESPTAPILATGFVGSLQLVHELFDWHDEGYAMLTAEDESTRTPGLFLVGPSVRHANAIFCFIYKFRQRFAVVAQAMSVRLGVDTSPLHYYRQNTMMLEDLSCCDDECVC